MKNIGFMVQVIILAVALPLLSILELNHVKGKKAEKHTGSYVVSPAEKNAAMPGATAGGKAAVITPGT